MEKKKLAHVAIIMDGNGRWAKSKHLPRVMGHHAGVRAVERTVRAAKDLDIPYISLYAFSTENWKRPKGEVLGLMGLFRYYMNSKLNELCREKTRMRFAISRRCRKTSGRYCAEPRKRRNNTRNASL